MIDLRDVLADMAYALENVGFPDADKTAAALHLDMSAAKVTMSKSGSLGILGARLKSGAEVNIAAGVKPRRTIFLLFENSQIPYRNVAGMTLGDHQQIIHSKLGPGLGVRFQFGDVRCAMTVSGPDGVVDSLSCEARKA